MLVIRNSYTYIYSQFAVKAVYDMSICQRYWATIIYYLSLHISYGNLKAKLYHQSVVNTYRKVLNVDGPSAHLPLATTSG